MTKSSKPKDDAPATVHIRNESRNALHIAHLRVVVEPGAVIAIAAEDAAGLVSQDVWQQLTEEEVAAHVASLNSDADANADAQNEE